jgi:hypothetical protein
MNETLKKLNWKTGEIAVIDAPEELAAEVASWKEFATVSDVLPKDGNLPCAVVFVKTAAGVAKMAKPVHQALVDDGLCWFVYPKKTSKKYRTDISRDSGWEALNALGYRPVRLVALSDDWSAFRFRLEKYVN